MIGRGPTKVVPDTHRLSAFAAIYTESLREQFRLNDIFISRLSLFKLVNWSMVLTINSKFLVLFSKYFKNSLSVIK